MTEEHSPSVEALQVRDYDEPQTVLIRTNPVGAILRAAGSSTALALGALITATATILNMAVANDIADAKLYSSRGFNNLTAIHWVAGTRLIIAGVALVMTLIAGVRFSRSLPATRYTFSDDGEEAVESIEGGEPPGWVPLLVGSAFVVSVVSLVLNAVALIITLHLHESPNFGIPGG